MGSRTNPGPAQSKVKIWGPGLRGWVNSIRCEPACRLTAESSIGWPSIRRDPAEGRNE